MRRRWITILAVAGLLAASITGGAVMAQEAGSEEAAAGDQPSAMPNDSVANCSA